MWEDSIFKEPHQISSNLNRGALLEPSKALEDLRHRNINRLVFGQFIINYLRNKFDSLQHITNKNIDVLLRSETKIFFFFFSTISFRGLWNPIEITQKYKWSWHPAARKRRYFFSVIKFWPINWRVFLWNKINEKDMVPFQLL